MSKPIHAISRMILTFGCLVPLSLPLWATVTAETYTIAPDGSGDFATIQAAVAAAADGDVIELLDGVFTGAGNRDIEYLGKAITIRSAGGDPQACIIDCQGAPGDPHSGFRFASGEPSGTVLSGVTVRGAWGETHESGGAVVCHGECAPAVAGCVFVGNIGSAAICSIDCRPSFSDCRFAQNVGFFGTALYADRCAVVLTDCEFTENLAEYGGAAIWAYESTATISGCTFVGNGADGASAVYFNQANGVWVSDCLFADNVSTGQGAALSFWISYPNTIERCTFLRNVALAEGAAIWSEKISHTTVRDCTFWGNSSPNGSILAGHNAFVMENCLVAGNPVGPGVFSYYDYAELYCCDVFGNAGGDWVGTIADQLGIRGNIWADPLLCDPDGGDLQLDCASPCAAENNPDCGQIGAWGIGCGASPARAANWGGVKALFR